MTSLEIEQNLKRIVENFSPEDFLYDLLLAYGISKTSTTRLKSGDYNLSKIDGEILYKKKVFFRVEAAEKLLIAIESVANEERILRHSPRFAIVTDYKNLVAKDLKSGKNLDIAIKDLPNHYAFFLPLAGSEVYHSTNDNEADRNAAYKMATLYDALVEKNQDIYNSKENVHNLNVFLSRLLFCFFAEDTEIFETESIFTDTLHQHTNQDGSDTHLFLNQIFEILNTEKSKRINVPAHLTKFEYVNGGLFRDSMAAPVFTAKARNILLELGELNWRYINPDIFGSMIQAVVIPEYRSDLGMHYTSVPNIQKLIKPLFLDELYEEFEVSTDSPAKLRKLISRMAKIKFFDPACGSGNFLIVTYKEIRLIEIKIIQQIIFIEKTPLFNDTFTTSINLTQFYGIELDDFAHEMAILSLWLAEHQMNRVFEDKLEGYGKSKPILPLKQAGKIVRDNAARLDWKTVCPIAENEEVYIIGNPPYLGSRNQDEEQKDDMKFVFRTEYKSLDYVSIWFFKASDYIKDYNSKCAFVSTNSICQGEQVGIFWPKIAKNRIEIFFAYTSFKWTNNAKGNAGVEVVIIGMRNISQSPKYLFINKVVNAVDNINPYLTHHKVSIITKRTKPLSFKSTMTKGCYPTDGGGLLLNEQEFNKFSNSELKNYLKTFIGTSEFIKGIKKWCIYINDDEFEKLKDSKLLNERLEVVKKSRLASKKANTKLLARTPYKFEFDSSLFLEGILIPGITSQRRDYLPVGSISKETVVYGTAQVLYTTEPYLFGVLSSRMHMIWMKVTCGRMKSDYNYSSTLCYNTFPFPDISLKQKETLNLYVYDILDARGLHSEKTMAQLYDPDKMPQGLRQAHQALDRAVEQCYRLQPFTTDTERLEYLFRLYEEMTQRGTLFAKPAKKTKKK